MRFPRRVGFLLLGMLLSPIGAWAQKHQVTRFSAVPQNRVIGRTFPVVEEILRIDCVASNQHLSCSSESELIVENSTGSVGELTLEVDLHASQLKVFSREVPLLEPEGQFVKNGVVALNPGTTRITVTIPNAFEVDASVQASTVIAPVIVTRHPQLARYPGRPTGAELTLQSVAATKRWKEVRQTRILVTYPGDWERLTGIPECTKATATEVGCTKPAPDGRVTLEWVTQPNTDSLKPISRLFPLAPEGPLLTNGGLLLGIGWGGGGGCLGCIEAARFRVGYETGINIRDLLGLFIEYSPSERVMLIPTLERAILPNLGRIPAMTAGIGFPVKISPDLQAGIRGQLSLTWPLRRTASLGFFATLDHLLGENKFHHPVGIGLQLGI
jgi:hypothetical protein